MIIQSSSLSVFWDWKPSWFSVNNVIVDFKLFRKYTVVIVQRKYNLFARISPVCWMLLDSVIWIKDERFINSYPCLFCLVLCLLSLNVL